MMHCSSGELCERPILPSCAVFALCIVQLGGLFGHSRHVVHIKQTRIIIIQSINCRVPSLLTSPLCRSPGTTRCPALVHAGKAFQGGSVGP